MKGIQQELDLFAPPSFDDIIARNNIRGITISFNKRFRASWHLTTTPDNKKTLVIPALLKDAPVEIKNIVIAWTLLTRPRLKKNRKEYYTRKRYLERMVWQYLETRGVTSKRRVIKDPEKFRHKTRGITYDLQELFDEINRDYFGGRLTSYIRWGTCTSKTSYQLHAKDTRGNRFSLITIAGVYNHPKVPEFAIKGVIFHEMLHIAIPAYKKNGRTVQHGPEFKKAELAYPYLKKWQGWEKRKIHGIIRSLKRKKK